MVPGTRPTTWTDSRILTASPLSLPLSVPEAQIDLPVEKREGDTLPGAVTLSKPTQASELPRSPDQNGDTDPSGKIPQDLSQPVVANNAHLASMIQSPVEQVNYSPKMAKRNKSKDSTSSPRPLSFGANMGNSETPQTVASVERKSEATEIPPAPPKSYDPPFEGQRASEPHPRSRLSNIGDANGGLQGRSGDKPSQESGESIAQQGEGSALEAGVGTLPPGGKDTLPGGGALVAGGKVPPVAGAPLASSGEGSVSQPGRGEDPPPKGRGTSPRHHGKNGPVDETDVSTKPKKKRGLLSIICPCFG